MIVRDDSDEAQEIPKRNQSNALSCGLRVVQQQTMICHRHSYLCHILAYQSRAVLAALAQKWREWCVNADTLVLDDIAASSLPSSLPRCVRHLPCLSRPEERLLQPQLVSKQRLWSCLSHRKLLRASIRCIDHFRQMHGWKTLSHAGF